MIRYIIILALMILSGTAFGNLSIEGRIKFQSIDNSEFSSDSFSTTFNRLLLKSEFELGYSTSVFLEAISAYDSNYTDQKYSFEQNEFDLHQGYLTVGSPSQNVRIGRQVWSVGNQRILGKREGTNVRRRFDGVMFESAYSDELFLHVYHGNAVKSQAGVFDDSHSPNVRISGIYFTTPTFLVHTMLFRNTEGEINERRLTTEAEYRRSLKSLHTFAHIAYQQGDSNEVKTKAWFGQFSALYDFGVFRVGPTFSYASGGEGNSEDEYFRPLFAKAPFYSEAGIFATTNLKHFGGRLDAVLSEKIDLHIDIKRLKRVNSDGHIYSPGRRLLIINDQLTESFVADMVSVTTEYRFTQNLTLELVGSYIDLNNSIKLQQSDSTFFESMLHYSF